MAWACHGLLFCVRDIHELGRRTEIEGLCCYKMNVRCVMSYTCG